MIMHDIKVLKPQPFSSLSALCNALSSVGISGTICQELEITLQEMVTKHGGEEHILKHGLDFWAAQILQNGAQRVMDFRNGGFGESPTQDSATGLQQAASTGALEKSRGTCKDGSGGGGSGEGRSGASGSRDGGIVDGGRDTSGGDDNVDEARGDGNDHGSGGDGNGEGFANDGNGERSGGDGSDDGSAGNDRSAATQGSAEIPDTRQVRFLTRPIVPLDQNAELDLPPMPELTAMVNPDECPDYVHFFHGCPWIDALAGIKREGVQSYNHGGFYSSCPATYWTTSTAFAIWWCATLQAKERAVNEGVWRSLNKPEKRMYKRDAVPESLDEVSCLVVQSSWSKEDLYQMHIYILDPGEEQEVLYHQSTI
jgi:hypothetical protein